MTVSLSVEIQHHPARTGLGYRLFNMLNAVDDEGRQALVDADASISVGVTYDPDPAGPTNPWRTARLAWSRADYLTNGNGEPYTHHMVIQDDALPCRNFLAAAVRAIAAKPDVGVSFFLNYLATQTSFDMVGASRGDARWVELREPNFVPTVALVLPRTHAVALAREPAPPGEIADDLAARIYADRVGLPVWCTIPNLVQHDETVPSSMLGHLVPDSRQRWATCWIGEHDALALDWA